MSKDYTTLHFSDGENKGEVILTATTYNGATGEIKKQTTEAHTDITFTQEGTTLKIGGLDELITELENIKSVELEKKAISDIRITKANKPENYIISNDKITLAAFNNTLTGVIQALAMEKKGSKKTITTYASVDFDELSNIEINKELTAYDNVVYNAIVSLIVEGKNKYISIPMIYGVMTGKQNPRPEKTAIKEIRESIAKLTSGKIKIDATEEGKYYNLSQLTYEGHIVEARKISGKINGQPTAELLEILAEPFLYSYANEKNQIGRAKIELLDTPVNKTKENIVLQNYLIKRVLNAKKGALNRTILYATVYKELKIPAENTPVNRNKKAKIRETVKRILDDWKSKGFIKDYTTDKTGNKICGITLEF